MSRKKASATALLIAQSQLVLSHQPRYRHLIDSEYVAWYKLFLQEVGLSPKSCKSILREYWLRLLEGCSIPGVYLHYTLRKKYIKWEVERILDGDEATQVVVLAAGLDPLALSLAQKYPEVNFFEVDLATTQAIKLAAIKLRQPCPNVCFISADLRKDALEESLLENSFATNKQTIFIAEGISMYLEMYLEQTALNQLLKTIASLTERGGYLLLSFMEKLPNGSIQFHNATPLVNFWLWLKREPFRWGISHEDFRKFLKGHNFQVLTLQHHLTLRETYLTHSDLHLASLAQGESVALAKRNSDETAGGCLD